MTTSALARVRDETGHTHALGLVRVGLGALLAYEALSAIVALGRDGYWGDTFHLALVPEALVPSRRLYASLLVAELALSLLVIVGRRAREALLSVTLLGAYLALCDRIRLHNNQWALLCYGFLLSFAPCDRTFVVRRKGAPPPSSIGPLWAQRLVQAQLSLIYLASGGAKLFDRDWRDGFVLGDRIARYGNEAVKHGVPEGFVEFLAQPEVSSAISKLAIATELLLAIALWLPKTRVPALWWGLMFHLTIEVTQSVEIFTWLTLTIYSLFARTDHRARTLVHHPTRGRTVMRVVRALDWLARFEIVADEREATFTVVRRDGSRVRGALATAELFRALPLLFALWPPIAALAALSSRRVAIQG